MDGGKINIFLPLPLVSFVLLLLYVFSLPQLLLIFPLLPFSFARRPLSYDRLHLAENYKKINK